MTTQATCKSLGDIQVDITLLPEDTPITGNLVATGDDAIDDQLEKAALKDLLEGNPWAWCTIRVTVTQVSTGKQGHSHLGCCSYTNAREFLATDYYREMVSEAIEDCIYDPEPIQ